MPRTLRTCRRLRATPFVLLAGVLSTAAAGSEPADAPVPRLTVRGDAEIQKPADRLRLTVGVVTQGQEPTPALEENSRKMNRVVEGLRAAGLEEGEYETGRFHVRPVYSPRPRQPDPAWTQQIIAYEVTHTVLVETRKLDRAGRLIEAANRAGANTIGEVQFDLAEPRVHRGEAIAAATANALADARALARAAGVKLVRILSLDLDGSGPPIVVGYRADMAAEAGVVTPPITPGDITVRAGVTVVYEIAPGP